MLIHFDFDGVIGDSLDPLLDLSVRAQQSFEVGRAPTRDDFRTMENLTFYDRGIRIGRSQNLASGYANEIFTLQKEKWDVDVFPDIVPVVWELTRRHTLVTIPSSHGQSVSKMLEHIGDVRQGKHAGVRTVAVTWGYQDRELLERETLTSWSTIHRHG